MSQVIDEINTKPAVYKKLKEHFEKLGVKIFSYDAYEELSEELAEEGFVDFADVLAWMKEKGLDRIIEEGTPREAYPHYSILSIFSVFADAPLAKEGVSHA